MQNAAGGMGRVRQPVLPLLPGGTRAIGPSAGLAEGPDGGVVFVFGLATFVYAAGDETGRRLAAMQLVTSGVAAAGEVAAAFGVWSAGRFSDRVPRVIHAADGVVLCPV